MNRERLASSDAACTGQPVTPSSEAFRDWVLHEMDRRRGGDGDDDGLAALLAPDPVTGYRLSDDELVVHARNLCQAAQGSTRLLIGNLLLTLAQHPDLYRRLAPRPVAGADRHRGVAPPRPAEQLRQADVHPGGRRWPARTSSRARR